MFSSANNAKHKATAKESWLSGSGTGATNNNNNKSSSAKDVVATGKSAWPPVTASSGSRSMSSGYGATSSGSVNKQMDTIVGKMGQMSAKSQFTSSQTSSSASATSWGKQESAQTFTYSSNGSFSKTSSASSSSSASSYAAHKSNVNSGASRHEVLIPSSINKNVMDKATNLLTYKSPDRIGLLAAGGRTGIAAGSKYLNNQNAAASATAGYSPVYSRTPGAGYSAALGTGALATAAALYPAINTSSGQGSLPSVSVAKLNNSSQLLGNSKDKPAKLSTSTAANSPSVVAPPLPNNTRKLSEAPNATIPPINSKLYTRLKAKEGYLMIFNQQHFKMPGVESRQGSQMDEEALCRTFYEFGFKPIVKRDLKLKELEKVAQELRNKDFNKYECVVIVVLSHGHTNQTIFAADGSFNLQTLLVDRVAQNETLRGKAKIFIVAACKGDSEVSGKRMQTDATPMSRAGTAATKLPYMRDTLQCFSTYEGFVSYRDPQRGTVFVQELCRILKEEGESMHIEDILKHVNVALTERPTHQQVPTVTSTMSFNLFFSQLKH